MAGWEHLIDCAVPAERSLILRYHRAFSQLGHDLPVELADLEACSLREGARVVPLGPVGGAHVYVCDETSVMETGTYKDLDACLTVAIARANGIERLVLSSGGNLGYALARYASRVGVELFVFQPATTLYKLDGGAFANPRIRLIPVDLPEPAVKDLAQQFAEHYSILQVPDFRWRLAASAVRAMFILEHALAPSRIDHLAQTMCAGFGPVGIYECFSALTVHGSLRQPEIPRFLGFQQEANCPMVRAWADGSREIGAAHVGASPQNYLEPGLYNTNPGHSYTRLFGLMKYFGGDLLAVSDDDYARYLPEVLDLLAQAGVELTRLPSGDLLEKTGVLTGVGILKAIATGRVRRDEGVLWLLTGGHRARPVEPRPVQPLLEVDASRSRDEWIVEIGRRCGLQAPASRRTVDRLFRYREDI
jgi:threonine synthase